MDEILSVVLSVNTIRSINYGSQNVLIPIFSFPFVCSTLQNNLTWKR